MIKDKVAKQIKSKKNKPSGAAKQTTPRSVKSAPTKPPATGPYTVFGLVLHADGTPAIGVVVTAYDQDLSGATLLGTATTDRRGAYEIAYTQAQFRMTANERGGADVFVRVHNAKQEQVFQSKTTRNSPARLQVNIKLPAVQCVVRGAVRSELGELLNGVTVQAFDRDLRSEQLLGNAQTKNGQYEIRYLQSQFAKAEKDTADLVMKVLDVTGKEVYKTPIRFNTPAELQWDINLQGATYTGPSEWEVLLGAVTPLLDGVTPRDLREDEQLQDISFLASETGEDTAKIALLPTAYLFSEKTKIAPEIFYGLFRQQFPT
ncbi:MAG: hypothetical protein OEW08_14535, partial [Gammaproteobacteria bacterium]|nr:hypothetical protein [Gammaproteobacteria bacterium]